MLGKLTVDGCFGCWTEDGRGFAAEVVSFEKVETVYALFPTEENKERSFKEGGEVE